MKDFRTVMIYTMKEFMSKKSFLITNIVLLVIIVVMFNIPNIVNSTTKNQSKDVLVVDSQNLFEGSLDALNSLNLGYNFQITNDEISNDDINSKVNNKEIIGAIVLSMQDNVINFDDITGSIGNGPDVTMMQTIFSKTYSNLQLSKLNLSQAELAKINTQVTYNQKTADNQDAPQFSFSIIIFSIALFFAIYFCAYQVSSAITTEKTSKVMQTLITSASPRSILLGKTVGTGLVGLIQVVAVVIVSIISYKAFITDTSILNFSNITPVMITFAIIYFILGYTLYAFMYALVGSTVSKPEDIQTANMPVAFIAMLGFYFGYFTVIFSPGEIMSKVASIVPFSAPFNMPFRMMMTNVPVGEIIASIAVLVVTIAIVIRISIRIYSGAVLHYGSKINLKDMFKLYKQK